MSKFIEFRKVGANLQVINRKHGSLLGEIFYYNPWKQPCFFPVEGAVFNDECLLDILVQIKNLKN